MTRWALISSESGADNAACALDVVARLGTAGLRTAGFVQRRSYDDMGRKRYEVARLHSLESVVLAVDGVVPRGPKQESFCSMAFHDEGFEAARRWLEADLARADVLLLDGIGKMESAGRGHAGTLRAALRHDDKLVLMCVRASQLGFIIDRFELGEGDLVGALELPVCEQAINDFVGSMVSASRIPAGRRAAAR